MLDRKSNPVKDAIRKGNLKHAFELLLVNKLFQKEILVLSCKFHYILNLEKRGSLALNDSINQRCQIAYNLLEYLDKDKEF